MAAAHRWRWKTVAVQQRWEVAAVLVGVGGNRRTCDDGIGVSVVKAEGLMLQG